MANVSLAEIPTKDILTSRDHLNLEVIHGKFNLSYKTSLISCKDFFLQSSDIVTMTNWIDAVTRDLEKFVYGPGNRLMTKDEMDATFMPTSESKYYRQRLLTDEVMEDLVQDYATRKQLSAVINSCKENGQMRATALANALAAEAAVAKTQQYINEANAQIGAMQATATLTAADTIKTAMQEAASSEGSSSSAES